MVLLKLGSMVTLLRISLISYFCFMLQDYKLMGSDKNYTGMNIPGFSVWVTSSSVESAFILYVHLYTHACVRMHCTCICTHIRVFVCTIVTNSNGSNYVASSYSLDHVVVLIALCAIILLIACSLLACPWPWDCLCSSAVPDPGTV
jgi:hypothetical protein